MGRMNLRCIAILMIFALSACSNGRGSLTENSPPPAAPGQVEPPPATPPPPPTPTPEPTPEPTPTPPPPIEPPPTPPPPPPQPTTALAGYWLGTLTARSGRTYGARAFVSGDGDLHLSVTASTDFASTAQFVVYGNVCCEANVDTNLQSRRYLDSREHGARFRASAQSDVLSGDLKIRGDDYAFSLDRSTRYAQALTLNDLAGTYSRTTTVFLGPISTYTVTIDANGTLTGSHTNGCVYNGTATIADPPRNLVKLSVELSNCPRSITGSGSMSGSYTGFGILARNAQVPSDPTNRANLFMHTLVGPTWLGLQTLEP